MNLKSATIVLRHRTALEVLDLSLLFVRAASPKNFAALAGIVLTPALLALISLKVLVEEEWWLVWTAALLSVRFLELPFTLLTSKLVLSREVSLREILRDSRCRLPGLTVTLALYFVLLLASGILILAPLFVAAHYFFLSEVHLLERAPPQKALGRARRFIRGRSETGIEGVLLKIGISLTFVMIFEICGQALLQHVLAVNVPMDSLWEEGGSWFAVTGLLASIPYCAGYRVLAYINERTRTDGWDVQVAFLQLTGKTTTHSREPHAQVA